MRGKLTVILAVVALACWVVPATANTVTFTLPAGSASSGGPVSASAVFTTGADVVTVGITNTEANVTDVAQCISDLFFTLSGTVGTSGITSSSGLERTVNSDKTYADGSVVSAGWGLTSSGNVFHLNDLGFAGPKHTIIGPPAADNKYDAANPSIRGNGPHNPFLAGTVDFVLGIAGVTADTTVSNVIFSFGTTPGDNVAVPIPPTALLLGSGLLGLVGLGWRRKQEH